MKGIEGRYEKGVKGLRDSGVKEGKEIGTISFFCGGRGERHRGVLISLPIRNRRPLQE